MAFTEALKLAVRRNAHFSCCLCHVLGVEVHHIVPESENGPDTYDNAAPLCPSCHEAYGANQQKRKFIREARDLWYDLCQKRYASDIDQLGQILKTVHDSASKADISTAIGKIEELGGVLNRSISLSIERERYIHKIDRMQQRVQEIENELQHKSLTLTQLRKRESITQFAAQMAVVIANDRGADLAERGVDAYSQIIRILIQTNGITTEHFMQVLQNARQQDAVPEDAYLKLLYYATRLYGCVLGFETSIAISSSVVPTILAEFDKNPAQPLDKLQEILATRILAGDLDGASQTPQG